MKDLLLFAWKGYLPKGTDITAHFQGDFGQYLDLLKAAQALQKITDHDHFFFADRRARTVMPVDISTPACLYEI